MVLGRHWPWAGVPGCGGGHEFQTNVRKGHGRRCRRVVGQSKDNDADGMLSKEGGLLLTLDHLLSLLPFMATQYFSIASLPSYMRLQSSLSSCGSIQQQVGSEPELCLAIVEGTTPLGHSYTGNCIKYLAYIAPSKDSTMSTTTAMNVL